MFVNTENKTRINKLLRQIDDELLIEKYWITANLWIKKLGA